MNNFKFLFFGLLDDFKFINYVFLYFIFKSVHFALKIEVFLPFRNIVGFVVALNHTVSKSFFINIFV